MPDDFVENGMRRRMKLRDNGTVFTKMLKHLVSAPSSGSPPPAARLGALGGVQEGLVLGVGTARRVLTVEQARAVKHRAEGGHDAGSACSVE